MTAFLQLVGIAILLDGVCCFDSVRRKVSAVVGRPLKSENQARGRTDTILVSHILSHIKHASSLIFTKKYAITSREKQ